MFMICMETSFQCKFVVIFCLMFNSTNHWIFGFSNAFYFQKCASNYSFNRQEIQIYNNKLAGQTSNLMFIARFQECSSFRKIIDSIKDLVKNVNIDVTQKGISIQAMDSCHIALVFLQLRDKAFKQYDCQKPLTLGLAIENVAKILKIAGSDDSLTLSCQDDPSELKFRFESKRGDKISQFNLSLMTIDSQGMGIPDTDFTSICTMPSGEFARICKQFVNLSQSIKIETTKQNIKFAITGEIGTGSATMSQQDTGNESDSILLDVDEPVSLSFASRYLNLFSKAGGLSGQVTLNMSNETPLMVNYKIMGGQGDIKYYLAPKITEQE